MTKLISYNTGLGDTIGDVYKTCVLQLFNDTYPDGINFKQSLRIECFEGESFDKSEDRCEIECWADIVRFLKDDTSNQIISI